MIIDLSKICKDYGGVEAIEAKCELKDTEFLGEEFVFPDGLYVVGKITNNTKSLHLECKVSGEMRVHCARCQKEIFEHIEFSLSEILVREDESVSEDDDVVVYSGHSVDLDDIVMNHFLMNVSQKFLCKDDCKGLCPKCGHDLNDGDCGCSDDEIDPRWAALAEIMKNSDTE